MAESARCLALCEASAKKHAKVVKSAESASSSWLSSSKKVPAASTKSRLPSGIEWEILEADAVVCQGMTHALR